MSSLQRSLRATPGSNKERRFLSNSFAAISQVDSRLDLKTRRGRSWTISRWSQTGISRTIRADCTVRASSVSGGIN